MNTISTAKAREELSDILNRAAYGKERIILTRRGKPIAAVVPIEDVQLLEDIEDRIDLEEVERVLAEAEAKGEKPIPWERAKRQLGL